MPAKPNSRQYSQSINIIRDAERELVYYPTENSKGIFQQIISDYKSGIHVFNIVGSYGTGKSSFLWALEQNLVKGKPYFASDVLKNKKVETIRLVGDYSSIIQTFAQLYNVDSNSTNNEIFSKIYYQHKEAITKGILLVIVDEFGKFLEYASHNSPEKELYFLQEFAEFANNPKYNILFISTVHQNFDAYGFNLNHSQRQEWGKVKGRYKEITFNEPVEQLLRLVGDHLRIKLGKKNADDEVTALQVADVFNRSMAFKLTADITSDIALDVLPLDLIAANTLTISLQKYGQNERSLFSFLDSSDHTSLQRIIRESKFFHLGHVYDYLLFNFYSFIQSKYNPDYAAWKSLRNSLDEVERTFDKHLDDYSKIIKAIGLLHLTASQGSKLDKDFLVRYSALCLGIKNSAMLIENLKAKNIIIYRDHFRRFVLNEGTSLDVEAALIEAAKKVDQVNDVATLLKRYYALPPVLAKGYTYNVGTPRLFEFVITDKLRIDKPEGDVDGYIYLIFNEKINLKEVLKYSASTDGAPVVYVYYGNSKSIKDVLFELEKLRKVKEENDGDKVAVRLLNESIEASQKALNYFILGSMHSGSQNLKWIWNGLSQTVNNKRSFNQLLSATCDTAYPSTPIFVNELANKHKISHPIAAARKNYFKALATNWNKKDLGFEKEKFPPEKTIYLSLIKENHISISVGTINLEQDHNNIAPLWEASQTFLDSTRDRRKGILQFIEVLSARPFKLKQGLITFWVPSFLFIKRDEFALFGENGYIPYMTEETLDLIIRYPEKYEIKAFELGGVRLELFNKYRTFLQQTSKEGFDNQTFIDTIRPFLTFHRQLPDFAKNTQANLSKNAISLRKVISVTEDLEKTFFEDFPNALGYDTEQFSKQPELVEKYIDKLGKTIKEIRSCFELLVNRVEEFILDVIVGEKLKFQDYKPLLISRYANLKKHLVEAEQKTFIQRLSSDIDDRKAWINSISQTLVGKPLEAFNDSDEFILKDSFSRMIVNLDKMSDLTKEGYDIQKEDILGFEINSFIDGVNKTVVRLPKNKRAEIARVEKRIKDIIGTKVTDNQIHIVALANVIKELMQS